MAKKRANREGSIFQRSDGRWSGVVEKDSLDGKRHRKYIYGRTREEVHERLTVLLRNKQQGLPIPDERVSLEHYLNRWLEDVVKPSVRTSTFIRYDGDVKYHFIPALGKIPLAKLTPQQLQNFYTEKAREGCAPQSILNMHRVLHSALKQAVRWNLVARNVTEAVTPPKIRRREMHTLTPPEAKQLLEAAKGEPLDALYVLAVTTGMRQAELLALRWRDLDLEAGALEVRRTFSRGENGTRVETEPKSAKGKRRITLAAMATDALRRHRIAQAKERLAAGRDWKDQGLMFCTAVGSPIEQSNLLRRSFWPLLAKAGLPRIRFHDLRHTAATLLLAQGVHPKIVQELLGHSQISLTLDLYSHVLPTMQEDAAKKMEKLLGG